MRMPKSIILLSGPVGAGKTTVAWELISILPDPTVYIEGDTFWKFIPKNALRRKRAVHFKMIMTSMTAAAMPYALYGYDAIVDFSIPPWFLDTVRKMVAAREIPVDYVVIRPSETICADRAAQRAEGTVPNYAPYHDLYTSFDEAERYTISYDRAEAPAIAAQIKEGLQAGKFRIS
jgi:chloramphenicol 3-O-phosphotransferase